MKKRKRFLAKCLVMVFSLNMILTLGGCNCGGTQARQMLHPHPL